MFATPPERCLSVIIPVFNEEATIEQVVRAVRADRSVFEIIAVDDCSTDNSPAILRRLQTAESPPLRVISHDRNRGKGAAMQTGLAEVTGELVLVQDADLEYDPADYPALVAPFVDPNVQVVYGSRNLQPNPRSSFSYYWGGRGLSWVTNLLFGSHITDEATGYKVFRTDLLRSLDLEKTGFDFCAEVTGKLLRRGIQIHEVPISYRPRSREEGKKIRWHHGITAVWTLIRCRFGRVRRHVPESATPSNRATALREAKAPAGRE